MSDEKMHVSGRVDTHLSGGRWLIVALSAISMAAALGGVNTELKRQNELRERELQNKIRQTEIMQKQYILDSLRFAAGR